MTDRAIYERLDAIQTRIRWLEQAVEQIATAARVRLDTRSQPPEADAEIAALLRQGRRVDAVKLAVERLDMTLIAATEYVGQVEGSL